MRINNNNLNNRINMLMTEHGVPGLTIALIENGKIVESKAFGIKDSQANPMTVDTLFEAASLTKTLFSTLVMSLMEKDIVNLDVSIIGQGLCNNLPEEITPRMVLTHSSGLQNWCEDLTALKFVPGTAYSYSGQGLFELQHLIEKLLGRPWNQIMDEQFFSPLDLDAKVIWTEEIGEKMSMGFGASGEVNKIRDAIDDTGLAPEPNAAWSLYANANLFAEFLCHIINDHGNLSDETFELMLSPKIKAAEGVNWGLGWGLAGSNNNIVWHWGDNTGFKSFAAFDKEDGNGIVIFTNSDNGFALYSEAVPIFADMSEEMKNISAFIEHAED